MLVLLNVVAILDSFKGSLSSLEAGEAVADGVHRVYPDAQVTVLPLADGGEGTVDALVAGCNGKKITASVCGPRGKTVEAEYGILEDGTAVIEMAAAAGLPLLAKHERNPMETTTYGVGELIKDAIGRGCRKFLLGIGGSATNDGGVGMLQALGFSFLDGAGNEISRGAKGLATLEKIQTDGALAFLKECEFCVACDVTNPLCGPFGCSAVFAPQKGADAKMIAQMDESLARYAELTRQFISQADADYPGAGAAGGMGFACLAYLNATLQSGISLVLDALQAESYIRNCDVVITGEGRLDGQSAMGKAPLGVANLAKKHGKPVIALAGCITEDAVKLNAMGIDAFFPILPTVMTLDEAMSRDVAQKNLANTAEQVFLLIKTVRK